MQFLFHFVCNKGRKKGGEGGQDSEGGEARINFRIFFPPSPPFYLLYFITDKMKSQSLVGQTDKVFSLPLLLVLLRRDFFPTR